MSERETTPDTLTERRVGIGSIVKIHYIKDPAGYMESVKIVERLQEGETENGTQEELTNSPLGQALRGGAIGEIVSFSFSDDSELISVQIIDIR